MPADPISTLDRQSDSGPLPNFKIDRWGPIVLIVTGLVMAVISWQKWQDLIVDYGQQVYTAWQLSEGQVLYKDMTYLHGPFSAYLHALVFKIFGPGIMVMAWFNLGLLIALAGIIYALFLKFADELTATLATLTFLGVFAFGQYAVGGNYNFVCTYVSELSHGVFLSFIALYQFTKYAHDPDERRLAIIGSLMGLIYMTKPEVFLAAASALITGVALKLSMAPRRVRIRGGLIFAFSFAAPLLFLTMYFWRHMPLTEAVQMVLSPWLHVFLSPFRSLPLYHWITGTDDVAANLGKMILYAGCLTALVGAVFGIHRMLLISRWRSNLLAWPVAGMLMVAAVAFHSYIPWLELARPWPLFMVLLAGCGSIRYWKNRGQADAGDHLTLLVFALFSLVLLFKMFFNTHVYHYGFALALPATLLLIKGIVYDVPRWTERITGSPFFFRTMALTLVLIYTCAHIRFSYNIYDLKGYPVGSGLDRVIDYHPFVDPRGEIFNQALEYINQNLEPEAEFATLPDAIMLNYMARRKSPIKDVNLNPSVWLIVGDDPVLQELKTSSPPYIILVDRKFSYFGYPYFGKDYGKPIYAWVLDHYSLEKQIGEAPFTGKGFGIQILKRNSHRKTSPNA
ncbi:MAG: glycosyltransferase family 39 protein [Nitrospinaceae bacterium]|jgi:hypothetical protein